MAMQRFFGKKKDGKPPVTLDDASASMDARGDQLSAKIKKLDQELAAHKTALANAKTPGAKNLIKQKAMRTLKQKRMYEAQMETMGNQQFNIDQTRLTQQGLQDSITMVQAMKVANKELKKQFKQVNVAEVEDLRDDMEDLLEDADAMNEILGQSFGVPADIDEDALLDELDALDEQILQEEEAPAYLTESSSVPDAIPSMESKQAETATDARQAHLA